MRCPSDYCQKGETDHEGRAPFVEYGHEAAGGPPDEDEVRSAESAPLGDTSDLARPSAPALEVPEPHIQKCETGSSRSAGTALPKVPKRHPSQKEKSHTEVIYPKISPSVSGETGQTEPPGESAFFSFSLTRRASTTKWVTSGSMPRRP